MLYLPTSFKNDQKGLIKKNLLKKGLTKKCIPPLVFAVSAARLPLPLLRPVYLITHQPRCIPLSCTFMYEDFFLQNKDRCALKNYNCIHKSAFFVSCIGDFIAISSPCCDNATLGCVHQNVKSSCRMNFTMSQSKRGTRTIATLWHLAA